jgi:hypothetical protein
LPGYYTILYGQNGSVASSGFSPQTFGLVGGQTYSVQVDNYGACSFAAWADGSTANPRAFYAVSNVDLVAIYNCGTTTSTGPSGVTVKSVDQNGNPLAGYYTALWQGGSAVGSGFTPMTFSTMPGHPYSIVAESYGSCTFTEWSDGSLYAQRTFVATGTPQNFTAVYSCTPSGTSTVNVATINQGGESLSGYYITLWSNSAIVQSCFSPCSFTVNNGQGYQIFAADYGLVAVDHWSDGTVGYYPIVVPSQTTTISLTAVYHG